MFAADYCSVLDGTLFDGHNASLFSDLPARSCNIRLEYCATGGTLGRLDLRLCIRSWKSPDKPPNEGCLTKIQKCVTANSAFPASTPSFFSSNYRGQRAGRKFTKLFTAQLPGPRLRERERERFACVTDNKKSYTLSTVFTLAVSFGITAPRDGEIYL